MTFVDLLSSKFVWVKNRSQLSPFMNKMCGILASP